MVIAAGTLKRIEEDIKLREETMNQYKIEADKHTPEYVRGYLESFERRRGWISRFIFGDPLDIRAYRSSLEARTNSD